MKRRDYRGFLAVEHTCSSNTRLHLDALGIASPSKLHSGSPIEICLVSEIEFLISKTAVLTKITEQKLPEAT